MLIILQPLRVILHGMINSDTVQTLNLSFNKKLKGDGIKYIAAVIRRVSIIIRNLSTTLVNPGKSTNGKKYIYIFTFVKK